MLTPDQKRELRAFNKEFAPTIWSDGLYVLMAIPVTGNFYDVSVSRCGDNDIFDQKFGEYVCMQRQCDAELIRIATNDIDSTLENMFATLD